MEARQIRELIIRELPTIMQSDRQVHDFVIQLSSRYFADKRETESRFDRILNELRRDREEDSRKWEEQHKKWLAWEKKWDEHNRTQEKKWLSQEKKWEEQNKKWEEQNKKWEENQAVINQMLQSIKDLSRKHDSTIGALGSRWGLYSEAAFRNALKGILEESFDVQVLNVTELDPEGEVFGRPDQVEMDIIVTDGQLIVCEIKSSMSKSDMYTFERKVRFYEKQHNRTVDRILVISPMVDERAQAVADRLNIQVYSYADSIEPEIFDHIEPQEEIS